jgi:hypothetical protein
MNDIELDRALDAWSVPAVPPSLRAGLLERLPAKRSRRIRLRWVLTAAFAAGTAALGVSVVQNGVLSSDAGAWDEHTYVRRTRIVEPAAGKLHWLLAGGRSTGWQWWEGKLAGSVYLFDRFSHVHYGYSWTAEPAGAGQYLFTALPLDPSALREEGTIAAPPPIPAPAILTVGSAIEVPVYTSGTERVYDRIELSAHPMAAGSDRDPAQETVTMTLSDPKLYINGKFASDANGVAEARGLTSLIDVPGRGRFVLALYSGGNPAFIQAGTVRRNLIEFEWAGETFRVECAGPVSSTGDRPVYAILQTGVAVEAFSFGSGGAPNQWRSRWGR